MTDDSVHNKFILRQHGLKHGYNQDQSSYREYDQLFRRVIQHMGIGAKDAVSVRNGFIQQIWDDDSLNRQEMAQLVKGYGIGQESNATDAAAKFVKDDVLQLGKAYETYKRDNSKYTDNRFSGADGISKPTLRSRFLMADENSVVEPVRQTVQDVVNSDLFAFKINDGDVGIANSLFIDNAKHEATIRFAQPLLAARRDDDDSPHLLGSISGIKPYPHSIKQVDECLRAIIHDQVGQLQIEHSHPGLSVGVHPDNLAYVIDPFGHPRRKGFMLPAYSRQSEYSITQTNPYAVYRQDTSNSVPFGMTSALGLKNSTNTWREPLAPESSPSIPLMTAEDQLHKLNHHGHDLF